METTSAPRRGSPELIAAPGVGDAGGVRSLLESAADVNVRDATGATVRVSRSPSASNDRPRLPP